MTGTRPFSMSPPLPSTGTFEASPSLTAPREAGPRFAQRGLDRAGPMRQRVERRKGRVDSLREVNRLGEGRLPLEEGWPP
jgi:hypothetical protein